MMKQYEYLVIEVDKTSSTDSTAIRYKRHVPGQGGSSSPDTNDLGRDGWELIQFLNHPRTEALVGVFKREK
jgi:hypothetical protein